MSVCPSVRLSVRMNAEILETISGPYERWDLGNYKSYNTEIRHADT